MMAALMRHFPPRYSSAHGTRISNISKIHSAIVCCFSSLMAISPAHQT
jgi:hypothetical protein